MDAFYGVWCDRSSTIEAVAYGFVWNPHEFAGLPNTSANPAMRIKECPGILHACTYVRPLEDVRPGYGKSFAPILEEAVEAAW